MLGADTHLLLDAERHGEVVGGGSGRLAAILRFGVMDLLKACDEMKGFIETAQKLVEAWDADPDNYSQLEEGLSALKAELEKFKD